MDADRNCRAGLSRLDREMITNLCYKGNDSCVHVQIEVYKGEKTYQCVNCNDCYRMWEEHGDFVTGKKDVMIEHLLECHVDKKETVPDFVFEKLRTT